MYLELKNFEIEAREARNMFKTKRTMADSEMTRCAQHTPILASSCMA